VSIWRPMPFQLPCADNRQRRIAKGDLHLKIR
jgi:hypothetical protein